MTITHLHLQTFISITFHTSLMSVTLPENCHTCPSSGTLLPWASHISINWHTFLASFTTSWGLSHLLNVITPSHTPLHSSMTITPVHQLTRLSNTCHISYRTATLPDNCHTSPKPPYISPMTITPPHQLTHLSNIFHTSFWTVTLPVNYCPSLVAIMHS